LFDRKNILTQLAELTPEIANVEDEAIAAFVGKNYSYYQKKWAAAAAKKSPMSWNWAAFFLGIIWLVYRKMYGLAAIIVAILVLDVVIETYFPLPESLGRAVTWAVAALFGWFGNSWYKSHVEKKVKAINVTFTQEEAHVALAKQGGVNAPAAWTIGIMLLILLAVAVWAIFSGI